MQQVKFFKGLESAVGDLEAEINTWLAEDGVTVKHIFGNIAPQTIQRDHHGETTRKFPPSDVLIAVLYERA